VPLVLLVLKESKEILALQDLLEYKDLKGHKVFKETMEQLVILVRQDLQELQVTLLPLFQLGQSHSLLEALLLLVICYVQDNP
jgi:hypothetical protein